MSRIKLKRTDLLPDRTLGIITITDSNNKSFGFATLEPPSRNNEKNISCIKSGKYPISKRYSQKYGWHWIINNVPNRDLILIHVGNFPKDTKGCILIGTGFEDIDNDSRLEVINSKQALKDFNELLKNEKNLEIEVDYYVQR